ncbi:MAG TPA: glycosyltransferase, partial [Terriglobales bacterium]|nr:glycosyltransferase [Terriglobales bacterium]
MRNRPALLFYCQHSLGMGHLVRSLALARALPEHFRVVFLNGGPLPDTLPLPSGVKIINLPPLGFGRDRELVGKDASSTVDDEEAPRKRIILDTFTLLRPEAVLIEMFPFGRKKFATELLALLHLARNGEATRPVVACSLRDILAGREQSHDDLVVERANRYFDAILVHSDPAFARLEETFHPQSALHVPVHYTGFVSPGSVIHPLPASRRKRRVVVSAGGGLVGEPLLRAAIEAYPLVTRSEHLEMKVIAGPFLPEASWRELRALAQGKKGLFLKRSVPNLCSELAEATASISQCGYNSAMDLLRSRVSALVVPFAQGRENEQMNRARRLESLGALRVLPEDELNPQRLADEIRALLHFKPQSVNLNLDGARTSARIMAELV